MKKYYGKQHVQQWVQVVTEAGLYHMTVVNGPDKDQPVDRNQKPAGRKRKQKRAAGPDSFDITPAALNRD